MLGSNLSSEFGNSAETLKKCVDEIRSNPSIEFLIESNLKSTNKQVLKKNTKNLVQDFR